MERIEKCRNCGKDIDCESDYCPYCGVELKPVCENCGEVLVRDAKYCTKCGKRVKGYAGVKKMKKLFSNAFDVVKRFSANKNLISIIKYSFVVFVCLLAFISSFLGVVSLDVSQVSSGYLDVFTDDDINIKDADVDIYSIDILRIMFATTRNLHQYDFDTGIENEVDSEIIEELEDRAQRSYTRLVKELSNLDISYPSHTITLSAKARMALHDVTVDSYVLLVSQGDTYDNMNGEELSSLWVAGILSLINIISTALMLGLSIFELVKVIKRIRNGEEIKIFSVLDVFLPMLIALPVAVLLSMNPLGRYVSSSGNLVATIVFLSIAVILTLIYRFVKTINDRGVKAIIPDCIIICLCIIVIGCCFAPTFTVEVKTGGSYICDTELYSNVLANSMILSDEKSELEELLNKSYVGITGSVSTTSRYTAITPFIEERLNKFVTDYYYIYPNYLYANDALLLKTNCTEVIKYSCCVQLGLIGTSIMSSGYFAQIISVLFVFGLIASVISGNKKGKLALSILLIVMLLITFATSLIEVITVMHQMSEMECETFAISIAGGSIVNVIFAIAILVFVCITLKTVKLKDDEAEDVISDDSFIEKEESKEENSNNEVISNEEGSEVVEKIFRSIINI